MAVFKDPAKLKAHLKKALDAQLAATLISVQAELGSKAISPVDTGRLRSSWFAAEGQASSEVAPEGANSPNTDARGLRVDASKEYHLTNSLEYAQYICLEGIAVAKSPTWFKDFRSARIPKIQKEAADKVKRAFEL